MMTYPHAAVLPTNGTEHLQATATRIADMAASMAAAIDCHRRLPNQVLTELAVSGLLRAGAPIETDGLELDPGTSLRCAETIARGNASVGWCVSIATASSLLQAYMPESSRTTFFGNGIGVAAGVWHREAGHNACPEGSK